MVPSYVITLLHLNTMPYDLTLDANGTIYISELRAVTCLSNDGTFRWRAVKMHLSLIAWTEFSVMVNLIMHMELPLILLPENSLLRIKK